MVATQQQLFKTPRLRAERRAGELLRDMPKHEGGRPADKTGRDERPVSVPALAELGISKDQLSRWQKLAAVPDSEFEQAVSAAIDIAGEVSSEIVATGKEHRENSADAIFADVRTGSKRDAILHSVGANDSHGMRRTNEDKRRAVLTLLNDPEWSTGSDSEIARLCGVHRDVVVHQRPNSIHAVTASMKDDGRTFTHHKTGKPCKMRTANIGKQSTTS